MNQVEELLNPKCFFTPSIYSKCPVAIYFSCVFSSLQYVDRVSRMYRSDVKESHHKVMQCNGTCSC